jgi:DNA primase large subunit
MAIRRSSAPLDERSLYAEYPFLPGAESLLGGEPVSVRGLLEDPSYDLPRAIGRARVLSAVGDPRAAHRDEELARSDPGVRYLSFLFAQILLASVPSAAALRRWAVAEAKSSYGRLATAPVEELGEVARRLGVSFEGVPGDQVVVPLVDYLHLSVPVREADFRLARQAVDQGRVTVGRVRAARLVQEAIRVRLAVAVPLAPDVRDVIGRQESELIDALALRMPAPVGRVADSTGPIRPELFPPCIRKMQRTLQAGENLSHAGRFALAAFLHRVGADFESIVDAYRGAPDFDESVTRYQVEHITHRNGGVGYEPPECDTLRSHGLCLREGDPGAPQPEDRSRDDRCFEPTLRHPLQYYRRRGGRVVDHEPSGTGPEATPSEGARGRPAGRERTPSTDRR